MKFVTPLVVASGLMLAGCVTVPTGPSVMALPGTGKTYEQFRNDDFMCRDYALRQVGGATASQAATDSGVRSAAVGTLVGAAAGAAIGGHEGAGVGAGTGLLFGTLAGTGASQQSAYGSQRQYDNAYIQCMYAKGQRVPVSASFAQSLRQAQPAYPPLAPAGTYPPPPPGSPPPAPSGY